MSPGVERQSKKATLLDLLHRPLSAMKKEEQTRRYVAMCAVDLHPFSMFSSAAFQWYLGGFSPSFITEKPHPTTITRHLDELCSGVRDGITAQLVAQYESVKKVGWTGPWMSIQVDATSTHNTEFFTVSFSWISPDWRGMEQVNYCTKAFPGRHGADEIEPWLRQVGILNFKFQLSCGTINIKKNRYCICCWKHSSSSFMLNITQEMATLLDLCLPLSLIPAYLYTDSAFGPPL